MTTALLRLAPEFGGTTFGPFGGGSIALGSDARQCVIVLPASMGIQPVHAWLTPAGGTAWVIQPAVVGAGVFVFRGGSGSPVVATSAHELRPGDAFALPHAGGPRFYLEVAGPQVASAAGARPAQSGWSAGGAGGRRPPTAGQMAQEVKRQASTYAMTQGPIAFLRTLFFRAGSGALFQPRYVVSALVALAGAAVVGCGGLLTFLAHQF